MIDPRLKYYGSLLECLVTYPHFRDDFKWLIKNGYIKQTAPDKCKWLKSKTALAEYFDWISSDENGDRIVKGVAGGFWGPISRTFDVEKDDLSKLSRENGNPFKPPMSKAFKDIKRYIIPYRNKLQCIRVEKAKYKAIKIIINRVNENKPKNIHTVLNKIKIILNKNVE